MRRTRQLRGNGLREAVPGMAAAYAVGDKEVADGAANPATGSDVADLLDGLFDSVNLKRALDSGSASDSLDDFKCIAPQEQALVFDYFRGLSAADEETAVSHVEHCHYCREAVGVMGNILRAAGKECLHPGATGVEEAEAEAPPSYQELIWD